MEQHEREASVAAPVPPSHGARRVLFLTYDGLTDPLGRSQILPYLTGLASRGHQIAILSCEKPARLSADGPAVRTICERAGIEWHALRFHKRPPVVASILDVLQMKRRAAKLVQGRPFDLVHCRSYMAALVARSLKRRFGLPYLFDMRGFWADERVERGFWPSGNPLFRAAYRWFKRQERSLFGDADAVVSLTGAARREIESWPEDRRPSGSISVIPCCVDLDLFDPADGKARASGRRRLGLDPETPVMIYVGSLGPGYVIEPMFGLFAEFRKARPGAKYLIVSHHGLTEIQELALKHRVEADAIIAIEAPREEMPALIAAGDIGVSFIMPSFAATASSPTKVAEMLAMGVPVIANSGVGDTAEIIRESGAGAVVDGFDRESLAAAIAKVKDAQLTPAQVRDASIRWFNLDDGVDRYDAIYRGIGGGVR